MTGELVATSTSYARMLDEGLFKDPIPKITAAGKSTVLFNDSVQKDLQSEVYFPLPPTPRTLQRFRKNYKPGDINSHWGLHDQKLPAKEFAYGVTTNMGATTAQVLEAGKKEGIAEYMQFVGESVYASTKREPLGRPIDRGYKWPEETQQKGFEFGARVKVGAAFGEPKGDPVSGKEILFPRGVKPDSEEDRQRYIRSHGSYNPGEMATRHYQWPEEVKDPANYAFGAVDPYGKDTSKQALEADRTPAGDYPKTRIVQLTAEAYRQVNNEPLGRAKNNMQGNRPVPPDHAYGVKCIGSDTTVGDCIRGWYSKEEQLPEKDLGKCIKVGRRNVSESDRAYGVPCIRHDIVAPERRSCADTQNYGNEPGASSLLHPQRFESMGIPDEEFLLRRGKDELEAILQGAKVKSEHFGMLWDAAQSLFDDGKPMVSLDAYLYVQSQLINKEVAEAQGAFKA